MSTRWFFSSARVGAAASADGQELRTAVRFFRDIDGRREEPEVAGPTLSLVGPGEVLGFDRSMVLREEPPPGTPDAAENVLASVELAHADLPWLLSPAAVATAGGPTPQPWIALIVLAEDEAAPPRPGHPLPVLTAPVAALPPWPNGGPGPTWRHGCPTTSPTSTAPGASSNRACATTRQVSSDGCCARAGWPRAAAGSPRSCPPPRRAGTRA